MSVLRGALVGFALLGCVGVTTGCGSSLGATFRPLEQVPPEQAVVYVYRPRGFAGSAVVYTVNANGVPISKLPTGSYFTYVTAPGEIEFSAKTEVTNSIVVSAQAGGTYYVRGGVTMGAFVGHPSLLQVAQAQGEREIAKCKLAPGAQGGGE